jgi:hypothetical protein
MKLWAAVLCFSLPMLSACSDPQPTPFYTQASTLPQPAAPLPPGTAIAAEPLTSGMPDAAAYRILYTSEDINGQPVPVSGVVYIPLAAPPPGGRNVVAWAHPTTGIATGCAPSLDTGGFGSLTLAQSIPGLRAFISAGDVVTATDYQGLGVPGSLHPYLIGKSEGQNILDSVRAAERLPGADLSGNFIVWGHSQGGQAALFAGELAAGYAPKLHLAGIAAAAPPTDMQGELTEPFTSNASRLLTAYVYYAWSAAYHVPITSIVAPQAVPHIDHIATQCINTLGSALQSIYAARALNPVFISQPPATTAPWPTLFRENSPGHSPPGAPLLIVQGLKDPTVEPHWTEQFAAQICAQHGILDFQELKGVNHLRVAYKSLPIVESWIASRFAGQKAPDNCRG